MNKRLLQKNMENRVKMTGKRIKPKFGGTLKSIKWSNPRKVVHI